PWTDGSCGAGPGVSPSLQRYLPSRFCRGTGAGGHGAGPFVLNLDLGAAHGVADLLGPLIGFLAHDDLLLDARFLRDDGLLLARRHIDGAFLEGFAVHTTNGPVSRPPLDLNPLLAQGHAFLDGLRDRVDPNPYPAALNDAFADLQLLLVNRDDLLLRGF